MVEESKFIEVSYSEVIASHPDVEFNINNSAIEKWTYSKKYNMYVAQYRALTINHRERDYDYSFIVYGKCFRLSLYYLYEFEKWSITWGNSKCLTEMEVKIVNEILLTAIEPKENIHFVKNN